MSSSPSIARSAGAVPFLRLRESLFAKQVTQPSSRATLIPHDLPSVRSAGLPRSELSCKRHDALRPRTVYISETAAGGFSTLVFGTSGSWRCMSPGAAHSRLSVNLPLQYMSGSGCSDECHSLIAHPPTFHIVVGNFRAWNRQTVAQSRCIPRYLNLGP